jgi:cellobiose phosphorylase
MWRQFWKKSLNNDAYGLGLWSYGLEGETIGSAPEQFLMPFDMEISKNAIVNLLKRQISDTTQTDLFGPGEHTLLYKDLGLTGPPVSHKGKFAVPHHHSIYDLFSIYYYLIESGDLKLLDSTLPYLEGKSGTVWDHINTALSISVKAINERGLARIPANVGDWMDEFTRISKDGNAESEMLTAEIAFLLRGFSELAHKTNRNADGDRWMVMYERTKDAVNKLTWEGDRYIRAFSDRGSAVGSKTNKEGNIYLNAQSWPILSGIASPQQAEQSLLSVRKYLMSDFGPLVFSPSYSSYTDYIGTQSIYAPGFRNACIYLRPAGWAIAAACLANDSKLANDMYNAASLTNISKDIARFRCEPYVYPENYNGPDHRLKGQGEFQWNFGEGSAWMWASYVNYILGVRPVLDGLLIDPKIPSEWPHFKVSRPFRGSVYDIRVTNPQKVSSGVAYIKVDNKKIKGNVIPSFNDGKTHKVEVLMGAAKK